LPFVIFNNNLGLYCITPLLRALQLLVFTAHPYLPLSTLTLSCWVQLLREATPGCSSASTGEVLAIALWQILKPSKTLWSCGGANDPHHALHYYKLQKAARASVMG